MLSQQFVAEVVYHAEECRQRARTLTTNYQQARISRYNDRHFQVVNHPEPGSHTWVVRKAHAALHWTLPHSQSDFPRNLYGGTSLPQQ